MTYLDAAHEILKQAGQPLHYREITERALAQDLIQPTGLTPDATMGSRLYIAPTPEGMINPAPIPGTDLWIEANQSAKSVVRLVGKLLVVLGHDASDLRILLPDSP